MILQMVGSPQLDRLTAIRAACDYNGDGVCTADDAFAILADIVTDPNDIDGDTRSAWGSLGRDRSTSFSR